MSNYIAGQKQCSLSLLCDTRVARNGRAILSDVLHHLYGEYELLPSGQRYSTEQHLFQLLITGILYIFQYTIALLNNYLWYDVCLAF